MKQGRLVQRILVPVVLSLGVAWPAWAHKCDGRYVTQNGKVITVTRTGISDTTNLQCALDVAVKAGRGTIIELGRGKFYTAQLVATNFKGTIRGEGMKHTILQNLPDFLEIKNRATFPFAPPSADNPWPVLLTFVDGEITVRDVAIQIVGEQPIAKGWDVAGLPTIYALSGAIIGAGTHVDLRVSRVSVSGEPAPKDTIYGFNVYNGILSQGGLAGSASPALAGLYEVRDSRFAAIGTATDVTNLKDAVVVIENNTYGGNGYSMVDIGDVTNTNVRIANNNIDTSYVFGINVATYGIQPNGFTDSRLFIAHNTIKGEGTAININGTLKFSGKTSCHLVLNDTTGLKKLPAIVLGPGTKDCLVITHESGTVSDSGKGNRVITVPRR